MLRQREGGAPVPLCHPLQREAHSSLLTSERSCVQELVGNGSRAEENKVCTALGRMRLDTCPFPKDGVHAQPFEGPHGLQLPENK